ncbi:MAG: beta-lactamase family protein [Gammaproteobacteria bacterium]|nr:beta-lactamase family protein [Gammaproteobacteria bacterium]
MNRRRAALPLLAFLWLALGAAAPGLAQDENPESVGLSSQRLERVAELMQRHIDQRTFSGAVTLIARDDRTAYFRAQGLMDLDAERPMRKDAVFRIMSMTKPVVALSILIMVEEGKVRLTDPASRFIPELEGLAVAAPAATGAETPAPSGPRSASAAARAGTVPAQREITIRDLLTHTSGLMSGGASSEHDVSIGAGESLADVLPRLASVPLDFQPGTRWAYSGQFGFDVLVRVVEVASGMPFDAFAKERIFEPLGMIDTFFHPGDAHGGRIATLYRSEEGGLVETPDLPFVNGVYFSGGGGLFSTAEDYLKFALMLLNGGRLDDVRLVSRKTVDLMTSVFVPDTLPGRTPGEGYGLGVRVVTDPAARNTLLSEGSFGWSGAFNTHFFIDPEERLVGIFMTQNAFLETRQQLREDFETAVMQALIDDGAD